MESNNHCLDGLRVLITGAGGPAGYSVLERLAVAMPGLTLHAADASTLASGLHLVGERERHIVPRGDDPGYVDAVARLCQDQGIGLVIPTVDTELLPLSLSRKRFRESGTRLAVSGPFGLRTCADKVELTRALQRRIPTAPTEIWRGPTKQEDWPMPVVIKPRTGSGSRGVQVIERAEQLGTAARDGSNLIMPYLPGPEYSVDVFRTRAGVVIASVPRERLAVDSGVAIAARTLRDADLESYAANAVDSLGLTGTCNVQFRRDVAGVPRLLEINPRFPGTVPLTIAAGVDLPTLCVRDTMGLPVRPGRREFDEVAVVRRWQQQFVDVQSLRSAPRGCFAATAAKAS